MIGTPSCVRGVLLYLAALSCCYSAAGQELEPRAFSASPVGTAFLFAGLGRSSGDYVLDPAVPVGDVKADISFTTTGGGYTFDLFGHQARFLAVLPYAWGDVSGTTEGQRQSEPLKGPVDPRLKFSIGLIGAPALSVEEFARAPQRTVVGASLVIMPPIGRYDADRLVNLGYNRWAFKPEIGVSHPLGRWTFEASAGVWLFTANDEYFPGHSVREQEPITALQAHIGYNFKGGAWFAADGTWFSGGQTSVDGIANFDRQDNTRLGVTLSVPVINGHSVKLIYSTGASTRRGSDYDTISFVWQMVKY